MLLPSNLYFLLQLLLNPGISCYLMLPLAISALLCYIWYLLIFCGISCNLILSCAISCNLIFFCFVPCYPLTFLLYTSILWYVMLSIFDQIFLDWKFFRPKIFWPKFFLTKKCLPTFFGPNFFLTNNFFLPKFFFHYIHFLDQKYSW